MMDKCNETNRNITFMFLFLDCSQLVIVRRKSFVQKKKKKLGSF